MGITWKISGIFNADAEKVYSEISSIGDSYTPADIVAKAESEPDSELHKCFEWDNRKAADKYRIIQARKIITLLVIDSRDVKPDAEPNKLRAIVNVVDAPRIYEPITITVQNIDSYSKLLSQAKRELEYFMRKYKILKELVPVFEAANELLAE